MSEFIEPWDLPDGSEQKDLHLGRYRWAAQMIKGNVVANAACSTNYGYEILYQPGRLVVGYDRSDDALGIATRKSRPRFIKLDIQEEPFDGYTTLVCLETFEHLPRPWDFLKNLSLTVKELVMSVPIIPTKHFNEFHLHDFTADEVRDGLKNLGWNIQAEAFQDEEWLEKPTYLLIYATK